jgi:hypothetical protein
MAVMMLTQSATVSPFEVFVAEEQGSHEDRDAGRGEDETPVPLTSRLHEDPSTYVAWPGR